MNKKIMKRVLIVLLGILLCTGICINVVNAAYSNKDMTKIIGFVYSEVESNKQYNKVYDLDSAKKVSVVQSSGKTNGSQASILHQPNVYCVDKGHQLSYGTYNVGEEREVKDPMLAYILAHHPPMGSLEESYRYDPSQLALWKYIEEGETEITTDLDIILNGQTPGSIGKLTGAAKTLYDNAKKYASIGITLSETTNAETETVLKIKVTGGFEEFTITINGKGYGTTYKKGLNDSKTIEITADELNEKGYNEAGDDKYSVVVTAKKLYKVKYRILTHTEKEQQKMLVVTSVENNGEVSSDGSGIVESDKDVSLQKYITGVGSINASDNFVEREDISGRENKYATELSTSQYNHEGVNITKSLTSTGGVDYKLDNAVQILTGDVVEYTVIVYNNLDTATTVQIRDRITKAGGAEIVKALRDNVEIDFTHVSSMDTTNYEYYNSEEFELAANGQTTFKIYVKYNEHTSRILNNKVWILSDNDSEYRTIDADFVEMEKYSVSLEKFVTQVTDKDGNDAVSYAADREGKRHNENIPDGDENKNEYKKDNKVSVDVGDKVTYTIRLKNTGRQPVRVTQIYDSYRFVDGSGELKYGLQYVPEYGIKAKYEDGTVVNNYGKITNYQYGDDDIDNGQPNFNRYFIEFGKNGTEAKLLEPEECIDIYIQFRVYVDSSLTDSSFTLYNKAGIRGLANSDNHEVGDNDGIDNNYDMDWVKTKVYSIGLEKFVSKVEYKEASETEFNLAKDLGTGRAGKRFNITADEKLNENKVTEKRDSKVETEIGDYVTYTIRLQNTGNAPVKVNQIYDMFTDVEGKKLVFDSGYGIVGYGDGKATIENDSYRGPKGDWNATINDTERTDAAQIWLIKFNNPTLIAPGSHVDLTMRFKIDVSQANSTQINYLCNRAGIVTISNRNDITVIDSDNHSNNADMDFVETRTYAVSLEKYVSKVVAAESDGEVTHYEREGKAEHSFDNNASTSNRYKFDHPVSVANGNKVTYTITVKNDGESKVTITNIADYLPNGVESKIGDIYCTKFEDGNGQTSNLENYTNNIVLEPGASRSFEVTVTVTEPDMSQNLLKNVAEITSMKNRNGLDVDDTTGNNNKDADYIVLTHPILVDIIAEKVWYDNDNVAGIRPDSIQVQLYKNGKAEGRPVTLREENNWTYTWKDLYKYDNKSKNENVYTVNEVNVPEGYTVESETIDNKTIIKNKIKTLPVSKTVIKVWDDENDKLGKRPGSVEVQLYRDGNPVTDRADAVVILSSDNNWTYTWNNLDAGHRYTVDEKEVPKYYKTITESENIITITNSIDKPDYISKTVEKVWDDKDDLYKLRPNSIQVQLYKNGKAVTDRDDAVVTLNSENNWSYTWENLDAGNLYGIGEVSVPEGYSVNYSSNCDKFIITNFIPDPDPGSVTVEKRWNDNNDAYGERPDSIQVQLYENGVAVPKDKGGLVTISKDSWTYTWTGLEKDSNYTVREIDVPKGYISTYGQEDGKLIIENTFEDIPSPDVIIGGYVWNDKALDKKQDNYNGVINSEERVLEGIKVYLYRVGVEKPVSIKYTNSNGYYSFANIDIDKTVVTKLHEQYIKGPKVEGTNRWVGTYYSYYVVFEYDGVTYTSTPDGQNFKDIINYSTTDDTPAVKGYRIDSNAKEDNGKVSKSRENFNKGFNPINNTKGIKYTTTNAEGIIPQSNHVYDSTTMAMQSSTNLINFKNLLDGLNYDDEDHLKVINEIEDKLKYVGLGLRGRDIFDLELTSEVDNVKVTVNNKQGVYNYNTVTLRKEDLNPSSTTDEDMANKVSESDHTYVDSLEQKIRETDLDVTTAGSNYDSTQGLQHIEVTYKITVHNASRTAGTATKVTNYYDNRYTFKEAYLDNNSLPCEEGSNGTGYKSVLIKINPEKMLNQSETMDIYVVYTLNYPSTTLAGLLSGLTKVPTYNMAEITEYKTACASDQTEYTRGLIDKDSAPGSVSEEKVRLNTSTEGTVSTLNYYFGNNDLRLLKYEDDTFATPTLYYVKDSEEENERTITGTVFEDKTRFHSGTKIKSGNGKLDVGEVGVYGVTVELIEQVGDGVKRYTTTTDENGHFTFKDFLPGDYIIRYHYGDTEKTVIQGKFSDAINGKSYNGEDFQATNNSYAVKDEAGNNVLEYNILRYHVQNGDNKLADQEKAFWYAYNEIDQISTAKDNTTRRSEVSKNLVEETINDGKTECERLMLLLNNARDRVEINSDDLNTLIEKTKMFADTPTMELTVEETELINNKPKQKDQFGQYLVSHMNFGIAEVPVTKIDLQKEIKAFNLMDSTGEQLIAGIEKDASGKWVIQGNILAPDGSESIDISVEDDKLQGARLQVTYTVKAKTNVELNFDSLGVEVTIDELVDIIDNNLSYNPELVSASGKNSDNWEVMEGSLTRSSVEGINNYTTLVKTTRNNPLVTNTENAEVDIVLEKVLSSTDVTLEDIIQSTVDIYVYNNIVEITKIDYRNYIPKEGDLADRDPQRDRIRTKDNRHIIIPGLQYDTAVAEEITIHPPTGEDMSITYYVLAVIGLAVLALGVFGIKKYVIKK